MNLTPIKANMTELEFSDGMRILFSYKTPVAQFVVGEGIYRTSKKWSNTTTRHINKWIADYSAHVTITEREQDYFDGLIMGVK